MAWSTRLACTSSTRKAIHSMRCTSETAAQGFAERSAAGRGPNGSFTYSGIGAERGLAFALYSQSRRRRGGPCRPHSWRGHHPPSGDVLRRTTGFLSRTIPQAASGPAGFIRYSATAGRGLQPAVTPDDVAAAITQVLRQSKKAVSYLRTGRPHASIHTRSCCGPLPVPQVCGRC